MIKERFNMEISATGSDDGTDTYEIQRVMQRDGKKSLVIELYPTLSTSNAYKEDLSTMHMMNHVDELGWNDIRIVNLYSKVFEKKPTITELDKSDNSLAHIEELLEEDDIHNTDIVIAWGSSLNGHKNTINYKIDILTMLKEKGLSENVKCLMTDNLFIEENYGVHPLYLGLRHSREKWDLVDYPLDKELQKLTSSLKANTVKTKKKEAKRSVSKVKKSA